MDLGLPHDGALCDNAKTDNKTWKISKLLRLSVHRDLKYSDALPRTNLKSFSTKKRMKVSSKSKEVILNADKNLFNFMALISKSRSLVI